MGLSRLIKERRLLVGIFVLPLRRQSIAALSGKSITVE